MRKSDGTPDPASAYVGVITAASPMAPLRIGLASKLATVEPSSSLSHSTDTSAREFGYDGVVAAGTDLVVAAGTDVTVVVVVVVVPPEAVVVVVVVVVVVGILTRQPLRPGPRTPLPMESPVGPAEQGDEVYTQTSSSQRLGKIIASRSCKTRAASQTN